MRLSRKALAAAVAVAAALVVPVSAVPPVGASATPIAGTLSAARPVLTFTGQMHNPVPVPMVSNPDPTVCLVNCQLWSLTVATRSPFLVSVHNSNGSIEDGFDLYVYDPAGTQVASASGIGSNGQAVVVQPASAGTFTVAVTMTYAFDTDASYLGEARLMTGRSWQKPVCPTRRPCPVLPEVTVQPPSAVHINGIPPVASTPLGFPFPVDAPTGFSCYLDETAATGATRCLRFTSEVDNTGLGTLTLQIPWLAAGQSGFVPGGCSAQQVVTWSDGSTRVRPAGRCEFHPSHAHFHYRDFVEFSLHRVNADGSTGPQVAESLKESFCLADDGYFGFGTRGPNGPNQYVGQPDCNIPRTPTAPSPDAWVVMGNSPGWGDIYTWDTPDQYIDITTTPAGTYDIQAIANPGGALLLGGDAHSCAATRIKLTDTDVTVLKSGVAC